jgi:hypothetical protein
LALKFHQNVPAYDRSLFGPGRQMSSPSVLSATIMASNSVAAGFPASTWGRWETTNAG